MSFNYRVIKKVWPATDEYDTEEVRLDIHEVYYYPDGTIEAWSSSPVSPAGENVQELLEDIERFKLAAEKPILQEIDGKLVEVKD